MVDVSLSGGAEIVFVANYRHEGVRMRYRDYEEIEAPIRARFALTTATPATPPCGLIFQINPLNAASLRS